MARWDHSRSVLLRAGRSFLLWADRLPWWAQTLLLPPAALVVAVEWVSVFPKTVAVAALTLIAVYLPLIRSGAVAFSWGGVLSGLGSGCLQTLFTLYLFTSLLVLQEASFRWTGRKKSPGRAGASWLWDREIDGSPDRPGTSSGNGPFRRPRP